MPDLNQRSEYRLKTAEIKIKNLPRWVPPNFLEQILDRAGLPEEVSVLDDGLTRQVVDAFQLDPWVADVVKVQIKSMPAELEMTLQYRWPVAMVAVKQGMYPIDAEGVLLPPAYFSVADTKRFLVIHNVRSTPQGPEGTQWGDDALTGAANIAEALADHWKNLGIVEIHVPQIKSADVEIEDLIYEMVTVGGSKIIWGRAPGSDHPGELQTAQKLGRLEKYREEFGSFDEPNGPYEIDIRHWQEISRRPLTAGRGRNLR